MGKQPSLDTCGRGLKLGLIIGNSFFCIFGMIVLGIGVYLNVDQLDFVAEVFVTPILSASSALISTSGGLLILTSIIGCMGAGLRNLCSLKVYFIGMCLVYLLSTSGIALSIIFRSWVSQQLRSHMNHVLQQEYGVNLNITHNQLVTKSWDKAQQKWYCCGIDSSGWAVYRGSHWYSEQPGIIEFERIAVPESCCKKDQYGKFIDLRRCQTWILGPPNKQSSRDENEALYYKGCYVNGSDVLYGISLYLIFIGLVVSLASLSAAILSLFLIRRL